MGKLIKHEFRATARLMLPLYIVAFISGILAYFLPNNTESMRSISTFSVFIFGAALVCIGIMCFLIILTRFYKNVMTDDAYLTMTLPLTVHEFIFSELIVALIWIVLSIALIFLIGTIFLLGKNMISIPNFGELITGIQIIVQGLEENGFSTGEVILFCIEGVVLLNLFFAFYCLRYYFIMAVGQLFSKHRLLMCVVIFILLKIVVSISEVRLIMLLAQNGITPLNRLILIVVAISSCAVLYLPIAYLLSKKLNVQ